MEVAKALLWVFYAVVVFTAWIATALLKLYVLAVAKVCNRRVLPWSMNGIGLSDVASSAAESESVMNGCVVHVLPHNVKFVYQDVDDDLQSLENLRSVLWELKSMLEPSNCNSKHSEHRLYMLIAPGENVDNSSHCPFCYREYEKE